MAWMFLVGLVEKLKKNIFGPAPLAFKIETLILRM